MGLHKESSGGGRSGKLYVKRGAILRESDTELPGYELVSGEVDGVPYSKYIERHGGVDGMITDIRWYDTGEEYENRYQGIHVEISDDDDMHVLELPFASRPYDSFVKFAENIDFSKPIEFRAWPDKKENSTGFRAVQDGETVRQKYTKQYVIDNAGEPGACPVGVENKRTGKWNFDDQRDWLLDNLLENVVPKISRTTSSTDSAVEHDEPKIKRSKAKAASAAGEDRWAGVGDPIHDAE